MKYTPNIGFFNYIYSSKYVNILKKFNVDNLNNYEINIDKVNIKYFLIFYKSIPYCEINFRNSIVCKGYETLNNIEFYKFNNLAEYEQFKRENPLAYFKEVSIPNKYFGKDIISIQGIVNDFYSEMLIEELTKNNITGLHINYNNSVQLEFY